MKNKSNLIVLGVYLAKQFQIETPFEMQLVDHSLDVLIPFRLHIEPKPTEFALAGEAYPIASRLDYEDVRFYKFGTGGSDSRPAETICAAYSHRARKLIILDQGD